MPAYPEGETVATLRRQGPAAGQDEGLLGPRVPGRRTRPGTLWAGTLPAGCSGRPTAGRRGTWSAGCGTARSGRSGSAAGPSCRPCTRSASTRATRRRSASPSRAAASGRRPTTAQTWEVIGKGMKADYMPPELQEDPAIQDPHMMVQCPAEPGPAVGPAPQRRLPVDRRRPDVGAGHRGREAVGLRVRRGGPPEGRQDGVVRPGGQGRAPRPGGWQGGGDPDAGRRQVVRRAADGLPQENAYDLVFRHALAVDDTGDRLAIGSTTGGLWVSEDQGDHWQAAAGPAAAGARGAVRVSEWDRRDHGRRRRAGPWPRPSPLVGPAAIIALPAGRPCLPEVSPMRPHLPARLAGLVSRHRRRLGRNPAVVSRPAEGRPGRRRAAGRRRSTSPSPSGPSAARRSS